MEKGEESRFSEGKHLRRKKEEREQRNEAGETGDVPETPHTQRKEIDRNRQRRTSASRVREEGVEKKRGAWGQRKTA